MAASEYMHSIIVTLLLGSTALLGLLLARVCYNLFVHPLRSYPGPLLWRATDLPVSYHRFNGTLLHASRRLHEKYGSVVRLAPSEVSYADAKVWKEVWGARNPEFPKDPRRSTPNPNGASSILNASRDDHARFRRLLAHAFSEKGLREQEPRIRQYTDLLIDKLHERATSGQSTDIVDWYTSAVFDIIGELAWGEPFYGLRDGRVHDWIPAILGNLKCIFQISTLNQWGLGMLQSLLVDTKLHSLRRENYILAAQKTDRRAAMGSGPRGDFWDRVLIKSAEENKDGEGMTKAEMVNNCFVLALGGAETSATALSGATYLLVKHPKTMAKLVEEIRSTFRSPGDIDVHSVNRLPYLLAVLEETMRIYPPIAEPVARIPPPGGAVVCGRYVPEGTTIHGHGLAANHMSSNFHRPNDFIPERWLKDAPEEFANDNRAAFQPFAMGNRNCIGINLAYSEMRLILAQVLFHFDIKSSEEMDNVDWFDQEIYGIWQKGPLYVKLSAVAKL